jgi:hypothetical protein
VTVADEDRVTLPVNELVEDHDAAAATETEGELEGVIELDGDRLLDDVIVTEAVRDGVCVGEIEEEEDPHAVSVPEVDIVLDVVLEGLLPPLGVFDDVAVTECERVVVCVDDTVTLGVTEKPPPIVLEGLLLPLGVDDVVATEIVCEVVTDFVAVGEGDIV